MELKDIISLAEAAAELDLAPVSLRSAIARGTFDAVKVGNTWITTRQEVERYRRESLGKVGRPQTISLPTIVSEARVLGPDERTTTRQAKVKPTREPGT